MYKVLDKEFNTFDEVIAWAWNEHKIDVALGDTLPLEGKGSTLEYLSYLIDKQHDACQELSLLILGGAITNNTVEENI